MARGPKTARPRTRAKADVVKSSLVHALGTRFEEADSGEPRNRPTPGNRGKKGRTAKGRTKRKSGKR